jgi:hypothetical protein
MLKIPESIKIGCYTYKIELTDKPIVVGDKCNYVGRTDYKSRIISIANDIETSYQIQTLFHEIIHGIFEYFYIPDNELTPDNYEKIVDCISKGIVSLMQDNKEFFRGGINDIIQEKA